MTDIFISYSRDDQAKVLPIADVLKSMGWSVFMDVRIQTGERWDQVIETNLKAAKCVLVVWSPISVERHWVREEAGWGRTHNILVPVTIDGAQPPIGFTLFQVQDLDSWNGDRDHPAFRQVLSGISRLAGEPSNSPPQQQNNEATSSALDSTARQDWQEHDLDNCQDLGLLQAYEAQHTASAPLWAYKAKQRREAIEPQEQDAQSADPASSEQTTDFYIQRGNEHLEQGEYIEAIEEYSRALYIDLSCAEAYFMRGYTYEVQGEYDKAIPEYNEAIRLDPQDADAYYNRGIAYRRKGEDDKAIADYNEAIRINPQYADAYYNRGYAYSKKGEDDKAIVDYNEAIRINPQYAYAYSNRGINYSKKGEDDKAIADYNEAIRINPQYADAYYNRGVTYSKKGEDDKAIADYRKALSINPDLEQAKNGLKDLGIDV